MSGRGAGAGEMAIDAGNSRVLNMTGNRANQSYSGFLEAMTVTAGSGLGARIVCPPLPVSWPDEAGSRNFTKSVTAAETPGAPATFLATDDTFLGSYGSDTLRSYAGDDVLGT